MLGAWHRDLITACQFQLLSILNPDAVTIKSTQAKHTSAVTSSRPRSTMKLRPRMARLGRALFQLSCVRLQGELHKFMRCSSEAEHEYKKKKRQTLRPCRRLEAKAPAAIQNGSLIYLRAQLMLTNRPSPTGWQPCHSGRGRQ